jgi:transcriptional regulator with XRE-family HTH domain
MGRPASEYSPSEFGRRVQELRDSASINRRALSLAAGFSQSVVWQVEVGLIQKPSGDLVVAIADALGTTAEYLMWGRGKVPSPTEIQAAFLAATERQQPVRTGT